MVFVFQKKADIIKMEWKRLVAQQYFVIAIASDESEFQANFWKMEIQFIFSCEWKISFG